MNKAFEKILDMLKDAAKIEIQLHCGRCNGKTLALGYTKGIENAIKIVQEVAEEYKNSDYVNEIQEMALELAVYVLEEELWKYAWLENANNETGVVVTYKDAICIIKDMLKGSETDEEDI